MASAAPRIEWLEPDALQSVRCGVSRADGVGHIVLNRADKSNAFDADMWDQLPRAARALDRDPDVRVVVLYAEGKNFTAGLDLQFMASTFLATASVPAGAGAGASGGAAGAAQAPCPARQRARLLDGIHAMQSAFTAMEELRWPVVAAVHGACVGAGVDLVTACDVRVCSADAFFCVKEVDVAITADLGTLQRLPTIVGHGVAADLALTARRMSGAEAEARGLVSRCVAGARAAALAAALDTARALALKPPLALAGTKRALLHARDHSVAEGLRDVALFNAAMLLSDDMRETLRARAERRPPRFSRL